MTFKQRLELAPIWMIWLFIILPVLIVVLKDVGVVLWLFATAFGCFWLVTRQRRLR